MASTSHGSGSVFRGESSESDFSPDQHLIDTLLTQVDNETVDAIIETQKQSLRRFEKTNEMMSNCNALSEKRLERAKKEMAAHKEMIMQMKVDLEFTFRRIRIFKNALATKYPVIYKEVEMEMKKEGKLKMKGVDDDE
ncbi:unnamed protein product, partial [Mesorhabditis belari]|uniref:KxDL domain-containing protein n=1 Tax=Mesorhabditis belari TaxID=2138241 RepID=A0AAF3EXB4_9BILA